MRRHSLFPFLSASLFTLALGSAASAAPGLVTKNIDLKVSQALSPEDAARSVLASELQSVRGSELGSPRIVTLSSGMRIVKMHQMHKGLIVANRGAVVTFRGGEARFVASRIESDLPADVSPQIEEKVASDIASKRMGAKVDQQALAIWPTPDGARLVWAISGKLIPEIAYQPVVIIDAVTAEIIYVYNAVNELNLSQVFPSNPVKSPDIVDVTLPVGPGNMVLQNDLVQSLNCIDQKTVKAVNIMGFALDVHTCDLLQTAAPDANGDYFIPVPADDDPEDAFSEVSMFHHVNKAYDMFRGWDPALDVNGGMPIPTVSNLRIPQGFDTFDLNKIKDPDLPLVPFQNAFFAPANPLFASVFGLNGAAMWFGQGPINDYSYDGDVVYHEFVHAVVNVTLKLVGTPHMDEFGASHSPGGMNEALSDYFSSAITGDPDVGEYASQDFFPGSTAIRSLSNPDSCPTAIGGEVHQDATLFSGALWDVRTTLSSGEQSLLDEAVYAAMNASPTGDLSYDELANLIVDQAKPLVGDQISQAVSDAFTKRGVLPKCSRILEYTEGATLTGPKDLYELWFGLGTQTTGAKNSGGGWTPGVVQFHYTLPPNAVKLDFLIKEVQLNTGGILGGGGTPFAAKFLIRFGKDPITFTYKPTETNPDVMAIDGAKNGTNISATMIVPPGATEVYVMVGNTGQSDGAYTNFSINTTIGDTTGAGGSGGSGGSGGGGAAGGTGGDPNDVVVEGCGCSVPGSDGSTYAGFGALAGLALIAARRRRKDRRS